MQDDDEAFEAFVRGRRTRSVLEAENERVAFGYPANEALQKHGADLEIYILPMLEPEGEMLHANRNNWKLKSKTSIKQPTKG